MLTLTKLDEEREAAYDEYLLKQPSTLFYHSNKYRAFLKDLLGCEDDYLMVIDDDEEIHGVLPLMKAEAGRGCVYNSLPYYGSNGSITADSAAAHEILSNAYRERAAASDTVAATMVENPLGGGEISEPVHNLVDERISQITDIPTGMGSLDQLDSQLESSTRRNVRKASKSGYRVTREVECIPALRKLHLENMAALSGLAKSDRFFDLIPAYFQEGVDFDLYVARQGSEVAAALLVFYFNRTVEYFTPAVSHEHRSGQPLALILAQAMVDASQKGYSWWNWGGTWLSQEGVYRFKRKWGAVDRRYTYYTQLNDPAVLELESAEISDAYPNFFVVPFSSLRTDGGS